jgi:ABC-type dipeptide/oligopeptide/nickel transport system permease subunit
MLFEGRDSLIVAPWAPFFPAICIAGLAVAINFTADALAQSFSYGTDPRTRRL